MEGTWMTRGNPSHSVEIRDKEIRAGGGRGFSSDGEARVCVIRVSLFFFFFSFPFPLFRIGGADAGANRSLPSV